MEMESVPQIDLLKEVRIFKEKSGHERDNAFIRIFKQFEPLVFTQLKKLAPKPDNKETAIQFIRIQLFDILNEREAVKIKGKLVKDEHGNILMKYKNRLKFGLPQQMTKYISDSLDKRVNKDHFRFYASETTCIKGVDVSQYRFRNAKKRFMKKYHKEPEFSETSDLKEFTQIFSSKKTTKKQSEVLQIALNLNNPIESLEKKFSFDKNRNEFKLMDVLEDTNENPEEECIKLKNREILVKEIEATLPLEQANLIKLYFRLDTSEELTKEEVAEKLGWTRFSKAHKKTIIDASRVKNSIDASKTLMKQNSFLRNLLLESIS